ncbi:MAG: MBL fold metallo-hydrolase [Acidimicrobiia bacterium]
MSDRLYFRQLLSGRDFATSDPLASQMVNFSYLIGDRETGDAVVVDPAYAVDDLVDTLEADGMTLTGVLATHFHPDHIGGDLMGYSIEGVQALLEGDRLDGPVHIQRSEEEWVRRVVALGDTDLAVHDSGDTVMVGEIPVQLIHTPGHTPGSQCFYVDDRLVAGDTLFLDGCGRTDLPGSDPDAMYESIHTRLARIPDHATLFPGHLYSPEPSASLGDTRERNYVFRFSTPEQWRAMFGG